jgi:hypothetical protein
VATCSTRSGDPFRVIVLLLATGCRAGPAVGPPAGSPDAAVLSGPAGPSGPAPAGPPPAEARADSGPDRSPPADAAAAAAPDARPASDIPPAPVDAAPAPEPAGPANCANLPSGPLATTRVPGIDPVEDVTFDDSGNLYWGPAGGGIVKSRADGSSTLFVPQVTFLAGMRWTPSGDLYIASQQALEKVAPNGARTVVLPKQGLNGIEVDPQGRVYATAFTDTLIYRYDPQTNRSDVLSMGVIEHPNGLTFNKAFDILYVSHYGSGDAKDIPTLYRIPFGKDGTAGKTEVWVTRVGSGSFDGMAADECGNIYVANSAGTGEILRFTPDGKTHTVLVKRPGEVVHNFMWGRGQGWSESKLYIVSLGKGLFEVDPGVRGKKYW